MHQSMHHSAEIPTTAPGLSIPLADILGKARTRAQPLAGYLAMLVTLVIWTGFVLSIRAIGKSPLTSADVALLRFGIPGIALLPLLRSRWPGLIKVRPAHAAMILIGGGLPFFFAAAAGGSATSAAYVGALISGTAPLFVAVLGVVLYRQVVSGWRTAGLALIALGVVALLWTNLSMLRGSMLGGAAILLGASGLWACYTIGLRRAGVDAIACNILLCAPSFVIVLALIAWGCVPTHLGRFTLADAAPFVLLQGIGVGLVSGFTYGFAIRRLGAERSAVIGSLTPALASLLAVPVLGEHLDLSTVIGIALITGGVIFANVNFTKRTHQDA